MVETPTALVIGASGLVGASIAQHLKAAGWKVHAHMGRSFLAGGDSTNDCFAADLLDADSTRRAIQNIEDIHQVFYCARLTAQNLEIEGRQNISAFNNVLDALASCQNLRRILLIEGTKWYGSNRGRYLVPALLPPSARLT